MGTRTGSRTFALSCSGGCTPGRFILPASGSTASPAGTPRLTMSTAPTSNGLFNSVRTQGPYITSPGNGAPDIVAALGQQPWLPLCSPRTAVERRCDDFHARQAPPGRRHFGVERAAARYRDAPGAGRSRNCGDSLGHLARRSTMHTTGDRSERRGRGRLRRCRPQPRRPGGLDILGLLPNNGHGRRAVFGAHTGCGGHRQQRQPAHSGRCPGFYNAPLQPYLPSGPHKALGAGGANVLFDCTWPVDLAPQDIPLRSDFTTSYPDDLKRRVENRVAGWNLPSITATGSGTGEGAWAP